jgi:hypothetical protein
MISLGRASLKTAAASTKGNALVGTTALRLSGLFITITFSGKTGFLRRKNLKNAKTGCLTAMKADQIEAGMCRWLRRGLILRIYAVS